MNGGNSDNGNVNGSENGNNNVQIENGNNNNNNTTNNSKTITISSNEITQFESNPNLFEEIKLTNISTTFSPDELNKFAMKLTNDGLFELQFDDNAVINSFIANLKFAGFTKIDTNGSVIRCHKKANKNKKANWKAIKVEEKRDLIIEDELIDPFDSYQKFSKAEDCITRPKPCKNCSCGRANNENKAEQEKQKQMDPNFKPDCGKCYLGDAFRCGGCPYRGQPAFEPGEKIKFNDINQSENGMLEEEKTVVNVSNKTVKLDL